MTWINLAPIFLRDLPRNVVCRSLYVIEIGDGRIKVGIATDPASRLTTHRSNARAHGLDTGRSWVSPRRAGAKTEGSLIAFCAERATEQLHREYFSGVRFDEAVQCAAELTRYTLPQVRREARSLPEWTLHDVATVLLATTEDVVRELVATSALTPHDPDEDPPTFTPEALTEWLDNEPDLLALPRGGPRHGGRYQIVSVTTRWSSPRPCACRAVS